MWCWRRIKKIRWTNQVKNEEVLHRVKDKTNIPRTIKMKTNWIFDILCRNCLLKHVIEGTIEERMARDGKRGRRRKQLLDGLKKKRKYRTPKEEALDRTLWKTRFERGQGSVAG